MAVFEEKEMIFPRTDFEPAEFTWALMDKLCKLYESNPNVSPGAHQLRSFTKPNLNVFANQTNENANCGLAALKIVRAATTFAACEFITQISLANMELAKRMFETSDRVFQAGIEEADGHAS